MLLLIYAFIKIIKFLPVSLTVRVLNALTAQGIPVEKVIQLTSGPLEAETVIPANALDADVDVARIAHLC